MNREIADRKIQEAIDAAWPVGMISEEAMIQEIKARLDDPALIQEFEMRLHDEARQFMETRPDLRIMSLDEWLVEHREALSEEERKTGAAILDALYASE